MDQPETTQATPEGGGTAHGTTPVPVEPTAGAAGAQGPAGAAAPVVEPPDAPSEGEAKLTPAEAKRAAADAKRAAEKALLEQLGVEKLEDALGVLKEHRERIEAEKSEAQKLAEKAQAAEAGRAEAEAKLAAMQRRLDFQTAAKAAGAPEAVLEDAFAAYPPDGETSPQAVAAWLQSRPYFGPGAGASTRAGSGRETAPTGGETNLQHEQWRRQLRIPSPVPLAAPGGSR